MYEIKKCFGCDILYKEMHGFVENGQLEQARRNRGGGLGGGAANKLLFFFKIMQIQCFGILISL